MKNKPLWQQIFQYVLAAFVVIGVFWITFLLITKAVPPANKDAVLIVLGVLTAALMAIINFFYGSSKGSQDKDDIIRGRSDE